MKKIKKDDCFCLDLIKLNELKNIQTQIIIYKLEEIIKIIKNEDLEKIDEIEF